MDTPLLSSVAHDSAFATELHSNKEHVVEVKNDDHTADPSATSHSRLPSERRGQTDGQTSERTQPQTSRPSAPRPTPISMKMFIAVTLLLLLPPIITMFVPEIFGYNDQSIFTCAEVTQDGTVFYRREEPNWPPCNATRSPFDPFVLQGLQFLPEGVDTYLIAVVLGLSTSFMFALPLAYNVMLYLYPNASLPATRDANSMASVGLNETMKKYVAPTALEFMSDELFKTLITGFTPVLYYNLHSPIFIDGQGRQRFLTLIDFYPYTFYVVREVGTVLCAIISVVFVRTVLNDIIKKEQINNARNRPSSADEPVAPWTNRCSDDTAVFFIGCINAIVIFLPFVLCFFVFFGGLLLLSLMVNFPTLCNVGSLTFGKGRGTAPVAFAAFIFGFILLIYDRLARWLAKRTQSATASASSTHSNDNNNHSD